MKNVLVLFILLGCVFSWKGFAQQPQELYNFPSRWQSSKDSVEYTGQVFRQLLIAELKTAIENISRGAFSGGEQEAYQALWSYIDYRHDSDNLAMYAIHGESEFWLTATNLFGQPIEWLEGFTYDDIAKNKQLLNKLAGNDNTLFHGQLLGWNLADGSTPQDLLSYFVKQVAALSSQAQPPKLAHPNNVIEVVDNVYVSPEGRDYNQLIQKFLHSALSFSQIARDYLSTDLGEDKGLNADNSQPYKQDSVYTALEHHWDEAFGYFGASRDYLSYELSEMRSGRSIDTNQDGLIAMKSEKNFGFAVLAAKRDLSGMSQFSRNIFNNFKQGRSLITQQPEGYLTQVKSIAKSIVLDIEKVIAASVIHYINRTLKMMDSYGSKNYSFALHAKYWSEMKAYALAFQFNPQSPLNRKHFIKIHEWFDDQPTLMTETAEKIDSYKGQLLMARSLLKEIYGFTEHMSQNW